MYLRKVRRVVLALSAIAAILGAATLASATSELRGGITEVPQQWWSSLAAAPLVIGVVLAVIGIWLTRRARRGT